MPLCIFSDENKAPLYLFALECLQEKFNQLLEDNNEEVDVYFLDTVLGFKIIGLFRFVDGTKINAKYWTRLLLIGKF